MDPLFWFGFGFGLGLTLEWLAYALTHMDHNARVFTPFVRAA